MKIHKMMEDKRIRLGMGWSLGCVLLSAVVGCGGGSGPIPLAKPEQTLSSDKVADKFNWTMVSFNSTPGGAGISAASAVMLEGYPNALETNKRLFVFPNGVPAMGLPAGSTLRWKWSENVNVNIPATATLPADPA